MSEQGRALQSCPCGQSRYKVLRRNWLICTCGRSTEITPTLRAQRSPVDDEWTRLADETFKAMKGE